MERLVQSLRMEKSYNHAIEILRQQLRGGRPASAALPESLADVASTMPRGSSGTDLRGRPSIKGMREWLQKLGHTATDINKLNVIHVAGTKGKGSTCAFIESFLRTHGKRSGFPRRTGLYTSPHLILPEERIRINFSPLSKDRFTQYFFEVYDILFQQEHINASHGPRMLQLYALVAFHTFIREGVEAAIIETHHGGEFDATNFLEKPVVTVVTTLGMDHVKQLGPTIENIAWHKAGIFKEGARAFAAVQSPGAEAVLRQRASERRVDLQFVDADPALPDIETLAPAVQKLNCSLALAAVGGFLAQQSVSENKEQAQIEHEDIVKGIEQFSWPGRFQTMQIGAVEWYLDSAHNDISVVKAAEWFIETSRRKRVSPANRVLVFAQITTQRDTVAVFKTLMDSIRDAGITTMVFTGYKVGQRFDAQVHNTSIQESASQESEVEMPSTIKDCVDIWTEQRPEAGVIFKPDVPSALEIIYQLANHDTEVLVTGSQHLIGAVLVHLAENSTRYSTQRPLRTT